MEIKDFEEMLKLVPQGSPRRVVLAGSDGENMLKGLFAAQEAGFAQPVLVTFRTARARAFVLPIMTISFFARVTPV